MTTKAYPRISIEIAANGYIVEIVRHNEAGGERNYDSETFVFNSPDDAGRFIRTALVKIRKEMDGVEDDR